MFHQNKEETFRLRIFVETIGEHCTIRKIKYENKISELKEKIEGLIGIPRYVFALYLT